MNKKPILCLDFDGVIHDYRHGWSGASIVDGEPVPGSIEFLHAAIERFQVMVFSSRTHQFGGITAMEQWMKRHSMPTLALSFPGNKPPAFVTLDDRAITFTGEWPSIDSLLAFKPWNKR
jgi:hypothetical protein